MSEIFDIYYNDGGYKSYTFHVSDAYSLMQPEASVDFNNEKVSERSC
jgi:hypothetical protein